MMNEVINKSWEKETIKYTLGDHPISTNEKTKKSEYNDILHVPYIQGFAENLQKKLQTFTVGMVPKKGDTINKAICHLKQNIPRMQQKTESINLIVETVKNGTLARQGRKWRAENTSIRMMLRMEKNKCLLYALADT